MKKPDYKILANGSDITAAIRSRLLSLTVSDSAGDESDTVTITLDNRDNKVKLPPTGAELSVWIGDVEKLVYKGLYEVDELEIPLDDYVLSIHAKALKMKGALKAPVDATYDDITLSALTQEIAAKHGYEAKVAPELGNIQYPHIAQQSESDMNLLGRLAREANGFFKPTDNKLVILQKAKSKTASGKALPEFVINDPHNTSGRVTIQRRSDYQSVVVHWFDEENQIEVAETAGEGEPQYKQRRNAPSKEEALRQAQAKLDGFKRGQASLNFSRPLTPDLIPEAKLRFEQHHSVVNRQWVINSIEHRIDSAGVSSTSGSAITPSE